jgi:hypothetical protein
MPTPASSSAASRKPSSPADVTARGYRSVVIDETDTTFTRAQRDRVDGLLLRYLDADDHDVAYDRYVMLVEHTLVEFDVAPIIDTLVSYVVGTAEGLAGADGREILRATLVERLDQR